MGLFKDGTIRINPKKSELSLFKDGTIRINPKKSELSLFKDGTIRINPKKERIGLIMKIWDYLTLGFVLDNFKRGLLYWMYNRYNVK